MNNFFMNPFATEETKYMCQQKDPESGDWTTFATVYDERMARKFIDDAKRTHPDIATRIFPIHTKMDGNGRITVNATIYPE